MKVLTENQKRGLKFIDGFTKEQLALWARHTDSGRRAWNCSERS